VAARRRSACTGLLSAAALGGAFGWIGPMAYLLITEVVLTGTSTTPWIWPARPPHDLGGALCAYGVYAAGIAAVTLFGARDSGRRTAPEWAPASSRYDNHAQVLARFFAPRMIWVTA